MLGLKTTVTFGKHKGKRVEQTLETDTQYWLWLRDQKIKNDRLNLFDEEADIALRKLVGRPLPARVEFKTDGSPLLKGELTLKADREELYADDWGAF